MPAIRSPPALKFQIRQPHVVQNVLKETLTGAQIVRPSKVFDANFAYPESLLRLVREANLDTSAVFWCTLVVSDSDNEVQQYVLQATAAQLQPRNNKNRDGGVGLATWVHQTLYPPGEKPTQAERGVDEVPAVTDATFTNIVTAVMIDTCTQPNGPTRAEFASEVDKLREMHAGLLHHARTPGKRHRGVPEGANETSAARRVQTEESHTLGTPVRIESAEGALVERPFISTPDSPVIRVGPPLNATYRVRGRSQRGGPNAPNELGPDVRKEVAASPKYDRVGNFLVMRPPVFS